MRRMRGHGKYCAYCKREMVLYSPTHPTSDHVVPRSKGGTRTILACKTCNGMKGNMMPNEWQKFMHNFPKWWNMNPIDRQLALKKRMPTRAPRLTTETNG